MGTFKYICRDASRQLIRHWGVTLLTLITTATVFFIVGGAGLFSLQVKQVASRVVSGQVIRAFTQTQVQAQSLAADVTAMVGVDSVRVITPAEGLDSLKAKMGSQSEVISMAGDNFLPWMVEVKVARADHVPSIVRNLSSNVNVTDLIYAGALAERLTRLSNLAMRISLIVVAMALIVTGLVFYNTLCLSLEARRQEISVMLLVGATQDYVTGPFMMQGLVLGTFGAILAALFLCPTYYHVIEELNSSLPFLNLIADHRQLAIMVVMLVCLGFAVGMLCSLIAVRRRVRSAMKVM